LTSVAGRGIIACTGERRPNGPAIESLLRIAAADGVCAPLRRRRESVQLSFEERTSLDV
jgi:hypothetical protein